MQYWLRIVSLVMVAVSAEFACARVITPVWIVTNPPLFLANTPIAQWVACLSTFGLSGFLYFALFSLIPQMHHTGWRRWQGSLASCVVMLSLWGGGSWIKSRVTVMKMGFSVALVQPNLRYQPNQEWQPWHELICLTDTLLEEDPRIDLIVWPETSVAADTRSRAFSQVASGPTDESQYANASSSLKIDFAHFDIAAMAARYSDKTSASLLVGSVLIDQIEAVKYGVTVPQSRRMNCACLWSTGRGSRYESLQVYEKQSLMPLREYTPGWMKFGLVRTGLMPRLKSNELTPGMEYRTLTFLDSQGIERRLAVAICYESWLPWLPHYYATESVDAIVHLIYDGDFANYPIYTERMLGAIQLRAIETRTWQLVCSSWAGTAVIDPSGRIVKQLPPQPGVLRTNLL